MTLTESVGATGLQATLKDSSPYRKAKDVIEVIGDSSEKLQVSFQRTVRVPDGKGDSELPPGMGSFPLYSVANYKDKLPNAMATKGGLFFPMYRKYTPKFYQHRARGHVDFLHLNGSLRYQSAPRRGERHLWGAYGRERCNQISTSESCGSEKACSRLHCYARAALA